MSEVLAQLEKKGGGGALPDFSFLLWGTSGYIEADLSTSLAELGYTHIKAVSTTQNARNLQVKSNGSWVGMSLNVYYPIADVMYQGEGSVTYLVTKQ